MTDGQFWFVTLILPMIVGMILAAYVPGWVRTARRRHERHVVTLWLQEREQHRANRWH